MPQLDLPTSAIAYEAPFFVGQSGKELGLSHLLYVKLFDPADVGHLERLAEEHRLTILGNNTYMPLWYALACDRNSKGNALEMANLFYETGLFSAAQPDLMEDDLADCVNDPFFGD